MNSSSIEQLLKLNWKNLSRVFPHITLSDYARALELVYFISSTIKGRHCGNLNDKLSQYLGVVEYARLHSPSRVDNLEIGTLFGGSCLMKLFALKDLSMPGRMVCIDPMTGFYGNETDAFSGVPVNSDVFFENIERFGFSTRDVELRTCRSDAPGAVTGLEERSFATVMIGGDHSYEGVKNDWQRFSPFVADNGFLNIDDYAEPAWPHITRFLDEIAAGPDQAWLSRGVVGTTQIFCRNFVETVDQNKSQGSLPTFDQMISATIPQNRLAEDLTHLVDENTDVRLARVYLVLAKESSQKQQFRDCETWLRKSLLFGSSRADLKFEAFFQLGLCQIAQNLPHKAAGSFQIALNIPSVENHEIFQSLLNFGNAFIQANEHAKDEALYLNALRNLKLDPSQAYESNVTYATVREYNRFLDELPQITYTSGDLKNFQRPWIVDTIIRQLPHGGRLLEIGADKCELADLLQKKGYEVWVVDIFDEFGGGVARFEETRQKFPNLTIMRGYFHEIEGIPQQYFDTIYSCSVIEHTPVAALPATFEKIFASLSSGGVSVHAIDFTVQGAVLENYVLANEVLRCCSADISAEEVGRQALADVDTFFLSAAGHYQWRKFLKKEYDEYPYRKVTSLNIVTKKGFMTGISMQGNR